MSKLPKASPIALEIGAPIIVAIPSNNARERGIVIQLMHNLTTRCLTASKT